MRLTMLTPGETTEKTCNQFNGSLANIRSVLHNILGSLPVGDAESMFDTRFAGRLNR